MVLEFYNGHIRYNIAELVPAAEGYARLWIQGFNNLTVTGGFSGREAQLPGNGRNLVPGNHFQAVVNDGFQYRGQHIPAFQLQLQAFLQ